MEASAPRPALTKGVIGAMSMILVTTIIIAFSTLQSPTVSADAETASSTMLASTKAGTSGDPAVIFVQLDATKGARCLDGSPGVMYVRPGRGAGRNKWYIHHQGGGYCAPYNSCYNRSLTSLGSSTTDGPEAAAGKITNAWYMSVDPTVNPLMHDWNVAYLRYCDGGGFAGSIMGPVSTYNIYFSGKFIWLEAQHTLLTRFGLNAATNVVVGGDSAGGITVFWHLNDWCDAIGSASVRGQVQCLGFADSGLIIANEAPGFTNYTANRFGQYPAPGDVLSGFQWMYEYMNVSSAMNQDCMAHKTQDTQWECVIPDHNLPYLRYPTFATQSIHDTFQGGNVVVGGSIFFSRVPYLQDGLHSIQQLEKLAQNISRAVAPGLVREGTRHGAFLESCPHHTSNPMGQGQVGPHGSNMRINGVNAAQAFEHWFSQVDATAAPLSVTQRLWNGTMAYNPLCSLRPALCCGDVTSSTESELQGLWNGLTDAQKSQVLYGFRDALEQNNDLAGCTVTPPVTSSFTYCYSEALDLPICKEVNRLLGGLTGGCGGNGEVGNTLVSLECYTEGAAPSKVETEECVQNMLGLV